MEKRGRTPRFPAARVLQKKDDFVEPPRRSAEYYKNLDICIKLVYNSTFSDLDKTDQYQYKNICKNISRLVQRQS